MCRDCGCGDVNVVPIDVKARILARNDHVAAHNREHFFDHGIFTVNLMGSPGSGKTAVLEATARVAGGSRLAAIAGDLATDRDAVRLSRAGIRSRAIETDQACHLDAEMVHEAVHHLDLDGVEMLFIENVGNLVCPAVYDLGQHVNVVALSVTEGEDKPLKYPTMFANADLVLLTKVDLLPHLGITVSSIYDALGRVMPNPQVIALAALDDAAIGLWVRWLQRRRVAIFQESYA